MVPQECSVRTYKQNENDDKHAPIEEEQAIKDKLAPHDEEEAIKEVQVNGSQPRV